MSSILKGIAILLGFFVVFIEIPMLVSIENPCSVWSQHQEYCSTDITQRLGK